MQACLQILCIFWSKCFKGTFHLKFFPPIFLGPLFAGMLNSCMSACVVWLHAVSCSFSLQQRAFSCMPRPSCRLASSAPCAVRQSLRRRACPARSVQPRPAPCRPRQPRPSSPSPSPVSASVSRPPSAPACQQCASRPRIRPRQLCLPSACARSSPRQLMAWLARPCIEASPVMRVDRVAVKRAAAPSRTNATRRFQVKSREFFLSLLSVQTVFSGRVETNFLFLTECSNSFLRSSLENFFFHG